jgi:hypothetical protein
MLANSCRRRVGPSEELRSATEVDKVLELLQPIAEEPDE